MSHSKNLTRLILIITLLASVSLWGQNRFVLTTSPSKVGDVCGRHGLTPISILAGSSGSAVLLVSESSSDSTIANDPAVQSVEADRKLSVPELSGATIANLTQSTSTVLETIPGAIAISYFGSIVPSNYLQQAAVSAVRLFDAQQATSLSGQGIVVAVIDTGVDTNHPALKSVLVPGFNFITNSSDASELSDLDPSTVAGLTQSTSTVLEGDNVVVMNPWTAAILTQSTSTVLEGNVPQAFGHGTMTAGLVHLVAPAAKIMPLKAFAADGSSDLFNILQAIYYAADHGANVISMSFEISQSSPGLQNAIQYALSKNVTVVAASGNDAEQIMVYPAGYNSVVGVGSTGANDAKSTFTNFGTNSTFVAAPGEAVITSYPGGNYAAGWGTSFSTPLVAGEAALILQAKPGYHPGDVANAISRAVQVPQMGHGRIDVCQALYSTGTVAKCE